tara:strand:+ start:183 stop:617 length:435 start_codon:yes stop_codon:yes gene_type:complete
MKYFWILISILAMVVSGIGCILLKLIDQSKYDNKIILAMSFVIMGIISFFYLLYNGKKKVLNNCSKLVVLFVIFFAIILISTNLIMQYAYKISPNMGYSHIIIYLNTILILLAGLFLFKQKINYKCVLGIFISLFGVGLISFNQ